MRLFIDFFCCAFAGLALSLHAYVSGSPGPLLTGTVAGAATVGVLLLRRRLLKRLEAIEARRKNQLFDGARAPGLNVLPPPGIYARYKAQPDGIPVT